MKNKFTRTGLAEILKNAEFWLANPEALKRLLQSHEIVTAQVVRAATDQ